MHPAHTLLIGEVATKASLHAKFRLPEPDGYGDRKRAPSAYESTV